MPPSTPLRRARPRLLLGALTLSLLSPVLPAAPALADASPRAAEAVQRAQPKPVRLLRGHRPAERPSRTASLGSGTRTQASPSATAADGTTVSVVPAAPGPARSTWQVEYTGFSAAAQASFQRAVDHWAAVVESSVPIRVTARFADLGPGVLGSAGPTQLYQHSSIGDGTSFYPAALADALTGRDVGATAPAVADDISAEFSSTQTGIHYGATLPPAGHIDFTTVVMHELGHGLGFVGGMYRDGSSFRYYTPPFRYDRFTVDSTGALVTARAAGSPELASVLQGDALYWNGSEAKATTGGTRPRLYAPASWEDGSSYSHLDEGAYPLGDPHSLMTPVVHDQEVIHSPGAVAVGMFRDLGWKAALPVVQAPGAPTGVRAAAQAAAASVTWTAPASDGGARIDRYTVTSSPDGRTCTTAGATGCTVVGLSPASAYTFTVTARNTAGTGSASTASEPVTPQADETAPSLTVTSAPPAISRSTSATFAFTGTDPDRPYAALAFRCRLDAAAQAPCASPRSYVGLVNGRHALEVVAVDDSGNTSAPVTRTWLVDTVAPTVSTAAVPVLSLATSQAQRHAGADSGSGVGSYDVRYRRAAWNAGFGAMTYPAGWQRTTATSVTLSRVKGSTYCLSARSRDRAGNLSAWSAERCTGVALDDRSLTASSRWVRGTGSGYYAGTVSGVSSTGATLTRTGLQAKRVGVVATRCPGCGTVGVYWNGTLIKKISLAAPTTAHRQVLGVTAFSSVRTGTLTVRALNRASTRVDGLALSRT